uniref:hypothetical protein n=1 Tax=uncultured Sphingomonas sp. TaxID=158754 RepID=UPI0035CC6BFA
MAGEELRSGQLTQLLEGFQPDPAEVSAIFPAGPRPSAKVRAIVGCGSAPKAGPRSERSNYL